MKLIKQNKYNGKIVTSILSLILSFLVLATGCVKQKTEGKAEEEATNDKNTIQVDPNLGQTTQAEPTATATTTTIDNSNSKEMIKKFKEVSLFELNELITKVNLERFELTEEDNKKIDGLLKLIYKKDYLNIDCEILRSTVIKPTIVYYEKAAGKKLSSEELAKLINKDNGTFYFYDGDIRYEFSLINLENDELMVRIYSYNMANDKLLLLDFSTYMDEDIIRRRVMYMYSDSDILDGPGTKETDDMTIMEYGYHTGINFKSNYFLSITKVFDPTAGSFSIDLPTTLTIQNSMLKSIEEGRSVSEVLEENKDIISVAAGDKANIIYPKQKTIGTNKK